MSPVGWAPLIIFMIRCQADEEGGRCPPYEDFTGRVNEAAIQVTQMAFPVLFRRTSEQGQPHALPAMPETLVPK